MRILVDGSNLIHRLWHVMPAHRVLGAFASQLQAFAHSFNTSDISVALDYECPNWRRELCPNYKSGRQQKSEELGRILSEAQATVLHCGFEADALPGFEADDILATWSRMAVDDCQRAVIVSADKDLFQCLRMEWITIMRKFQSSQGTVLNPEYFSYSMFVDKYGFRPADWPTFRAIAGDSSDSMPGVHGIGEQTAIELMRKFNTVDQIAEALRAFVHVPLSRSQARSFRAAHSSGDLAKFVRIHTLSTNVPFTAEAPI